MEMDTVQRAAPADYSAAAAPALEQPANGRDRIAVLIGVLATAAMAAFGYAARLQIIARGMAVPQPLNVFFRLYALYEEPFLILLLVLAVLMAALVVRRAPSDDASPAWLRRLPDPRGRPVVWIGIAIAAIGLFVWRVVLHGYPLAMDEFTANFQAKIFSSGHVTALLPAAWRPFATGMTPIFVGFHPSTGRWLSEYLPVYALIKAPFTALGAGGLLNPLLGGATIVMLASVARQLWPGERLQPWVAVGLLATSAEFIVTSGSQYSMPAHLFLNVLWLWLYLRDDARSWAAALVVGALALGLHNPFPHALFVAPFLIRLARQGRWRRIAAAALVYGCASLLWLWWLRTAPTPNGPPTSMLSVWARPTGPMLWLQGVSLSLLFTWQAPVFGVLVIAALLQTRRLTAPLQDLAWGVFITLFCYLCFPFTQGHGWGDRYVYQVLGNLALLGAAGAPVLLRSVGGRRTAWLMAGSIAIALLIELPVRMVNAERFSRPFAATADYVHSLPYDLVLVHPDSVWYGLDLIRNDPFMNERPAILNADLLNATGNAVLHRAFAGHVYDVSTAELERHGMIPVYHRAP